MTLHNKVFVHIFQIFVLQIHTLHPAQDAGAAAVYP